MPSHAIIKKVVLKKQILIGAIGNEETYKIEQLWLKAKDSTSHKQVC